MTTLITRPGQGFSATVYVPYLLTGYTVSVEFANDSKYSPIELTKTPTIAGRAVSFTLDGSEVDLLKNSRFRIRVTKDGMTETAASGLLEYTDPTKNPANIIIIDGAGKIKAELLPAAHRRRVSASTTPMYANNGSGFGALSGTSLYQHARLRQRSPKAGRNVAIEFLTVNGPGEVGLGGDGSDITFRASAEYPAGTFYPAYNQDGGRDIKVTPGGGVGRLYVPGFEVPANQDWWVRLRQSGTVGGALLYTVRPNVATEWASGPNATTADLTVTNTGAPANGSGNPGYSGAPSLVSFEPYDQATPCVVLIGDSIAAGHGDDTSTVTYWTSNPGGFLVRALSSDGTTGRTSPGIPFLNLGCGSELAANWLGGKGKCRLQLLDDIDARTAWVSFTNDIFSNSVEQTQTDTLALWTMLDNRGVRVVAFTVTPRSSSTDNWATTANQTTSGGNSTSRNPYNQWLRAGAPIHPTTKAAVTIGTVGALLAGQSGHPVAQIVDVCPAVETAQDSGIWKATGSAFGYAVDGTHPSALAHQAMAAIVKTQAVPTII